MNGVKQIKFVQVQVDRKTYNRLIRSHGLGYSNITTPILTVPTKEYEKKLQEENEFLRIKHKGYYADFKISGTVIAFELIKIVLGDILDTNNTHYIKPDKK